MLEDGAADETDALVTALNKSTLQRSGPSFEPTSNPKISRYYDTDDDDDYIEVEEVELSAEELKAMRGPFGLPQRNAERRSPPQRRPPGELAAMRGTFDLLRRRSGLAPAPGRLVLDGNPLRSRRLAGRSRSRSRSRSRDREEECCMSDGDDDDRGDSAFLTAWPEAPTPAPSVAEPKEPESAEGPRLRRAHTH